MDGPRIAANLAALAQMAGVGGDPRIRRWIRVAALTGDEWLVEVLRGMIGREVIDRLVSGHPFFVPRHPSEVAGPVRLGIEVCSRFPACVDPGYGHILVLGSTRMGKTNLALAVLKELLR